MNMSARAVFDDFFPPNYVCGWRYRVLRAGMVLLFPIGFVLLE